MYGRNGPNVFSTASNVLLLNPTNDKMTARGPIQQAELTSTNTEPTIEEAVDLILSLVIMVLRVI